MSRSIALSDDLARQAEEAAARQNLTLEELVSAALTEQLAALEHIRLRAQQADPALFRRALAAIPDLPPTPGDELP